MWAISWLPAIPLARSVAWTVRSTSRRFWSSSSIPVTSILASGGDVEELLPERERSLVTAVAVGRYLELLVLGYDDVLGDPGDHPRAVARVPRVEVGPNQVDPRA
jgi:hypothetical protein